MAVMKIYSPDPSATWITNQDIRELIGINGMQADVLIAATSRVQAAQLGRDLVGAVLGSPRALLLNTVNYSDRLIALADGTPGVFVQPQLSYREIWFVRVGADPLMFTAEQYR